MLGELRLDLDAAVESPARAGAADRSQRPQLRHRAARTAPRSCGTRSPDFYMVGMKSYGRAPTFLMLTGYEQVRSVVAALAGDHEAARRVELTLPETGVCSATPAEAETALLRRARPTASARRRVLRASR